MYKIKFLGHHLREEIYTSKMVRIHRRPNFFYEKGSKKDITKPMEGSLILQAEVEKRSIKVMKKGKVSRT